MLERIFIEVLNMSLTGSIAILTVLTFRLLLSRFPRIFSYALWAVVLFRLLVLSPFLPLCLLWAPWQILLPVREEWNISRRISAFRLNL